MSNYRDLDITLLDQLPPWYREILDYQQICESEQEQFDALAAAIRAVADNFYLQTMDETAIAMWEQIFGIIPNLVTETVEFRRARLLNRISTQPPFTLGYLYRKLDALIGAGKWKVTVDYPNYTLYIESAADNQNYATELAFTIGKIKPAHIVYINEPLVTAGMLLSETISAAAQAWNYKLGVWQLSGAPFAAQYESEVVKMAETPSITNALLSDVADFVSSDVASARINGSVVISALTKSVEGNELTVTYTVTAAQTNEITTVELLDANGVVLTASTVYVPVGTSTILMEHKIPVKEGL